MRFTVAGGLTLSDFVADDDQHRRGGRGRSVLSQGELMPSRFKLPAESVLHGRGRYRRRMGSRPVPEGRVYAC